MPKRKIYVKVKDKNKPAIPNTTLERMFMRICNDSQMTHYNNFIEKGDLALATAYVSRVVSKEFFKLVDIVETVHIPEEVGLYV